MDLEKKCECQAAKGQGQPAKGVKISPLYSEAGICAQLCLSLLPCCALGCLTPLGQNSLPGVVILIKSIFQVGQRLLIYQAGGGKEEKSMFACRVS